MSEQENQKMRELAELTRRGWEAMGRVERDLEELERFRRRMVQVVFSQTLDDSEKIAWLKEHLGD